MHTCFNVIPVAERLPNDKFKNYITLDINGLPTNSFFDGKKFEVPGRVFWLEASDEPITSRTPAQMALVEYINLGHSGEECVGF